MLNSKVTVMFEIRLRCEREKGGTLHVKSASAAMIWNALIYVLVSDAANQVWTLHLDNMSQRRVTVCIFNIK